MSVPLISKDQIIGVLNFRSTKPNIYSEMDLRLAERVGNQIAGAIANAQLYAEVKRTEEALQRSEETTKQLAKENAIVAEIGRIVSSTLNIEEVYEKFAEEVHKLLPFDRIAVSILNHNKNTLNFAYVSGIEIPDRRKGGSLPLKNLQLNEQAIHSRSGVLVQINDEKELMERFPSVLPTFKAGLRSMISVPLISKDEVIGVLHLRSTKPNAYTERDLRLAERVGNQIAGAIENAQLFKDRKQAEEEMVALQEQLRQSQKMEAIGQLAGGIAHDFNNLLTVIRGYSQLSLLELKESDPLKENIEEIRKASQRAADLTRQLLAFSRRQILDFKVLDLNMLLQDLDKMLHRILGEDIELIYGLSKDLRKVKTDPGQIEQVILNLAVNARDVMSSGGKLTIEMANMELDETYARTHIGATPGHYVMVSVSDTGCGMSPELKEHIFEPFFSTKEKGKGTGLGLSTVYGIVKQSGGYIWVDSKPGCGTTFKIYLPSVEEEPSVLHPTDHTSALPCGSETVLIVEDEPSVRGLAVRVLREQGYTLLEAGNGESIAHCPRTR